MKKITAIIVAIILVLTLTPGIALAEEGSLATAQAAETGEPVPEATDGVADEGGAGVPLPEDGTAEALPGEQPSPETETLSEDTEDTAALEEPVEMPEEGEGYVPTGIPDPNEGVFYKEGEILVTFADDVPEEQAAAAVMDFTVEQEETVIEEEIASEEIVTLELPEEISVAEAVEVLQENPEVVHVQPNYKYSLMEAVEESAQPLTEPVNDPGYATNQKWYAEMINAPQAWAKAGTNPVKIAVIDTGMQMNHEDLVGITDTANAYDMATKMPLTGDSNGHGTHVAGIAAAQVNNGKGIAGISYNAKILPINVFRSDGYAYTSELYPAIKYAVDKGAAVINMSLGGYGSYDSDYHAAVKYATDRGVVVVAAAGNKNTTAEIYPSDFSEVISVIALDSSKNRWVTTSVLGSDYGPSKDISAPGAAVYSTTNNGGYGEKTGTSMASPVVAGVAALLKSKYPSLTGVQIRQILYDTAVDLGVEGRDDQYGYGLVDAYAAIQSVVPTPAIVVSEDAGRIRVNWNPVDGVDGYELWRTTGGGDREQVGGPLTGTSYTDTAVQSGVAYKYELRAYKLVDTQKYYGSYSAAVSFSLSLSAPQNVRAQLQQSDSSVVVSWNRVDYAEGYVVKRTDTDTNVETLTTLKGERVLTYKDVDAQAGKTYTYSVCSLSNGGSSAYSDAVQVTIPTGLYPPEDVNVTVAAADALTVAWSTVPDAETYKVYCATQSGGPFSEVGQVNAPTISYTYMGLNAGQRYYFKVTAVNAASGESDYSETEFLTLPTGAAGQPQNVQLQEAADGLQVSWNTVAGATGYAIERSYRETGSFVQIGMVAETTYLDSGLQLDEKQYYRVRAYTGAEGTEVYGPYSDVKMAEVSSVLPSPVIDGISADKPNGVTLSWNAVAGAASYSIYRSADGGDSYSFVTNTTALTYTDIYKSSKNTKTIERGKTYQYRVKAVGRWVGRVTTSDPGAAAQIATPAKPSRVTVITAEATGTSSIALNWDAVADAEGYLINYYEGPVVSGQNIALKSVAGNVSSLTHTNVKRGVKYTYIIFSYDTLADGTRMYGTSSPYAPATIPAKLGWTQSDVDNKRVGVSYALGDGRSNVTLKWNQLAGAEGYNVYRKNGAASGSGTIQLIKKLDASATGYTDANVTNGTYTYYFAAYQTIAGQVEEGNLLYAQVALKATLNAPGKPGEIKVASAAYNQLKISWSKVSNATGYEVYRATSANGAYSKVATISSGGTVSYINSSLTAGNTYYYKVRAVRAAYGLTSIGSYSPVGSGKPVPAKVAGVKAASTGYDRVKLSWGQVAGASGYGIYRATSSGGKYTLVKTVTGGSTVSYTNSGLTAGKTYYYKVRAYRTVSGNKIYGSYSAIVNARPVAKAPAGVAAKASGYNGANISWNKVAGASGYRVYRATSQNGSYAAVKTVSGGGILQTKVTGVEPGRTYYYKVRAYTTVGGTKVYGAASAAVSAKTNMAKVGGVAAASASYNRVKVTWTVVDGAHGYEICRAGANGVYALAGTVTDGKAANYTDKGLATGTTYSYKVRAYRIVSGAKVYGAYSVVVTAKPVPAKPAGLTADTVNRRSVILSWKPVSGASGYEVRRATGSTYAIAGTVEGGTTFKNTGLSAGTAYKYKVRAYRLVNGKKVYGPYSSVLSLTTK